ncbi:TIGR03618 family F420-dependent PPOX class oxidoreductase [Nocardioides sp. GY 10127]|uniref:TIGR03618 family F420-dependent PPOX class oxidoreductase n=1 Tax=Nocardioides sp. GY 10127 TaxID=2569762 RepID=UPI0010A82EAC|nr:TIGR03618 family F420-dependent PPOX class oxidoreductase [Nocardioides sp. GY 10127]TIC85470.1 TIGR03618 family F420-dependent PPOX class oxidoreductase [Nocardioides sp. GY 10127]
MASLPLPDDVRALLAEPNPAVVATLRRSGAPITVATWYLLEDDGRVLLNMDDSRVRLGHMRRDPRVSLTVTKADDWYTHVSLSGEIEEIAPDEGLDGINRLSRHYTGQDYPDQVSPRTNAWMRVASWHGWGATRSE